ncbi:MAG: TetR/AcrR family transcriptional regulator [Jatrophihabitans sp.]
MGDQTAPGLRERKKQQTRRALLEAAGRLFAERGYDNVTVAEIADAANISVKTLFTYFASKQDLAFGDEHRLLVALGSAIRQRPAGGSVIEATARLLCQLVEESEAGDVPGVEGYRAAYGQSTALQSRLRQLWQDYEDAVAATIADTTAGLDAPGARLLAMQVIALVRSTASPEVRRLVRSDPDPRWALNAWIGRAAELLRQSEPLTGRGVH